MVELRPVSPADNDFLLKVYAASRAEELELVPWDESAKQAFLQMQFTAQQNHYQSYFPQARHDIILADGTMVGRLYVDRREMEIRILDVTLLPEARGRKIGLMVLQDLMKEAEAAHKALSIYVDTSSTSMELFLGLGFKRINTDDISCLMEWRHL
jgi:N-acetylglutamate synthase-like GNAT family acetyltransferase